MANEIQSQINQLINLKQMQTNNACVIAVAKRVNHSSWPDGFIYILLYFVQCAIAFHIISMVLLFFVLMIQADPT